MPDAQTAMAYPHGDLRLELCPGCGFICNTLFDPRHNEYSANCEESQGFSPTFNAFAKSLAQRWVDRYDLHGKDILEIGCGKGEFLHLICQLGNNRGIGVDPSYQPARSTGGQPASGTQVRFVQDLYSDKYASLPADCILCRHTLEHIAPTRQFLWSIRQTIGDRMNTLVLFELPDIVRILKEGAFWDIYYEHCSYFSPGSLARLFRSCGFDLVELERDYNDQYLLIGARPAAGPTQPRLPLEDDLLELSGVVDHFREAAPRAIGTWRRRIDDLRAVGKRGVLWGSLSKGTAFLTTLKISSEIEYVVDINPHRQGTFMPGSGHRIVSPQFLADYRPDYAIVMNPIYCNEIAAMLAGMGLRTQLLPV